MTASDPRRTLHIWQRWCNGSGGRQVLNCLGPSRLYEELPLASSTIGVHFRSSFTVTTISVSIQLVKTLCMRNVARGVASLCGLYESSVLYRGRKSDVVTVLTY
ncbi:unnamed protein product [Schistocephalus solidus]|uniref:Uncharacterized protein n=1 Tax=Schistocephalus solidus TaxID=70667 RepID=A0A183T2Z1_SCHSO|nr:unnamed protein product [Schistocephalus solidus]